MTRRHAPAALACVVLLAVFAAAAAAAAPAAAPAAAAPAAAPATCSILREGVVTCSLADRTTAPGGAAAAAASGVVSLGGQVVAGLSCKAADCPAPEGGLPGLLGALVGGRKNNKVLAAGGRRRLNMLFGLGPRPRACFQVCLQEGAAKGAANERPAPALLGGVVYASERGIPDYGEPCSTGAQCASGICGTSCSKRDWRPTVTTSCLCPTNTGERPGCCGCLARDLNRPAGAPAVLAACPPGDATAVGLVPGVEISLPPYSTLPRGTLKSLYARLDELGAMDDELVQAGAPQKYLKQVAYAPPSAATGADGGGSKRLLPFGAPCSRNDECEWNICGTGCDCDSTVEARCSCNAQSGFPFRVCGGCNRGIGPAGTVVGACPLGVTISTFGGSASSTWLPGEGEEVTDSYCILLAIEVEVNGLRIEGAAQVPPRACVGTPPRAELWAAIKRVAAAEKKRGDPAAVDALFKQLAMAACKTPASDPAGCKCDFAALVRTFGAVDPSVCRPPLVKVAGEKDGDKSLGAAVANLLLHKKTAGK